MDERGRLYFRDALDTPYFCAKQIRDCRYFMLCVILAMRDLHFLSIMEVSNKLTITDLCESFILFLLTVQYVL